MVEKFKIQKTKWNSDRVKISKLISLVFSNHIILYFNENFINYSNSKRT